MSSPSARRLSMEQTHRGLDWRTVAAGNLVEGQKVLEIPGSTPIELACEKLVEYKVSSAPIYVDQSVENSGSKREYVGMFDYGDVIAYLLLVLKRLKQKSETVSGEDPQVLELMRRVGGGESIPVKLVSDLSHKNPFYSKPYDTPLLEIVRMMSGPAHRVAMMRPNGEIAGILSQSLALIWLYEHAQHSKDESLHRLLNRTLKDLGLGTTPVMSVPSDTMVVNALEVINSKKISSLAVVNPNGVMVGNISMTDVKYIVKSHHHSHLFLTCFQLVSKVRFDKGVEDGQDTYPVFDVKPESTLGYAMAKLIATKAHRVWVTDREGKPMGLVSLTDVLGVLAQYSTGRLENALSTLSLGALGHRSRLDPSYTQPLGTNDPSIRPAHARVASGPSRTYSGRGTSSEEAIDSLLWWHLVMNSPQHNRPSQMSSYFVPDGLQANSTSERVYEGRLEHKERSMQVDSPGATDADTMTLGKCICCNSRLSFPATVASFRCTVCGTINDVRTRRSRFKRSRMSDASDSMDVSSPSFGEPEPLTLRRIKELIALEDMMDGYSDSPKAVPTGTFLELEAAVKQTFGNWELLNASFSNHREVTLTEPGVDLVQVRQAYNLLIGLPVNIVRAMMTSIDILLRRPGPVLRKKEEIRFLVIILENPLLAQHNYPQESQYHHNIAKRVFGLVSCLSNQLHHYLVNWFARFDTVVFRKKVDLANAFITYRLSKALRAGKRFPDIYENDWRISSAARVMALLFAANNQTPHVPIYEFYNTMVDYVDLVADYDSWQQRSGKFAFCQYPFLISMGAKMSVMEIDAKRQMESKLKEAYFNSLIQNMRTTPILYLNIRREYLIEDSLRQLSENREDLKKLLKIGFAGEEGVDMGGLRKEWFLLLVRELFGPQYGMFTWDEDSQLCWFNPASFETSDQYYLVGQILGLAIYNSTILDIKLPLACYKKLFNIPVSLQDLEVFRPALSRGLRQLLEFDGDVEEVFCRDFVGDYEAFGEIQQVPLIPNGQNIPVTNANRVDYVERYVNFILNDSIRDQFEPFKRGFYLVCGCNALSLFRPEEIELLVRGSDEPLNLQELMAVTEYQGFHPQDYTIRHFWSILESMSDENQKRLLTFVTGSDKIPSTGTANMSFKITYAGEDCERHVALRSYVLQSDMSIPISLAAKARA
ncbi:hypothetical protein BZG36_03753 [Bifiguratus adelaidae]|uniref:HECT-type E3 ubiquitin transferase n=1 Tax=Bifiguratus adelaidae TaxID=1938954 RepID=A0A261XY93_9FUNG|nr:hypothetical protein BZG36_03753 [Bifiguratus adelaidae]